MRKSRGIWTALDGLEIPWWNLGDFDLDGQYLLHCARWERRNAYAPISDFLVGGAFMTEAGNIRLGHNSENVILNVLHAEGCALGRFEYQDLAHVIRLSVVGAPDEDKVPLVPAEAPVTCCGQCRQMIWEFCNANPGVEILMSDPLLSRVWMTTIGKLLPAAFGPEALGISPRKYMEERVARLGS